MIISQEAVLDTFTAAELYADGQLEVSDTNSTIICQDTGVADRDAARVSLRAMMGEVGALIPIVVEGEDF